MKRADTSDVPLAYPVATRSLTFDQRVASLSAREAAGRAEDSRFNSLDCQLDKVMTLMLFALSINREVVVRVFLVTNLMFCGFKYVHK